jgi:hypothetical protein
MARPHLIYALFGLLAVAGLSHADAGGGDPEAGGAGGSVGAAGPRQRILEQALRLVGTREATGHNDGRAIDQILSSVGLQGTRSPYCAAFNRYVYDQAGLRQVGPRSAWSPDWVAHPSWTQARGGATPLPGDTWGIYFQSKGRVAHTGLVERWGPCVLTIEGNTSPDAGSGTEADRNGDGIWRKRRLQRQIHSVRNWIERTQE